MRTATILGLLGGIALITALIAWQGLDTLAGALTAAGWQAFWLPLYFMLPMALAAVSWQLLHPPGGGPGLVRAWYGTWIGLAVNWLLPVAMVGGEVVRVRLLVQRGMALSRASAGVVADKALQIATQLCFALLGLALLLVHGIGGRLLVGVLAGLAVFAGVLVAVGFFLRAGPFARSTDWLQRITGSVALAGAGAAARRADDELDEVYRRRRRLAAAFVWRFSFRVVWAGEVWLALHFLGHPVSMAEAILIESLVQVVRGASFMIPAGLGTQDGAVVLLVMTVGLPAEVGLALALLKRLRELAVGLPALLAWQFDEARRALRPGSVPHMEEHPETHRHET